MSEQEKRIDELEKRIDGIEEKLHIVIDGQWDLDSAFNELYQYVKTQKECLTQTIDVLSDFIKSLAK